ncbi:MAG: hypothetical protein C5B49_14755 [Bdellovibrio sp.]|nr:MAG: hypothetical protein C5B49_14755 [Bdellovibrio sp.]
MSNATNFTRIVFAPLTLPLISILLFCACGTGGGTLSLQVDGNGTALGGTGGSNPKPLFSLWTQTANEYKIDLRSLKFGMVEPANVTAFTGQSCVCQALVQGTDASGKVTLSSCSGSLPTCSTFNSGMGAIGTYMNSGTSLQLCLTTTNCDTFY